jgi:predicted dehydrogenase
MTGPVRIGILGTARVVERALIQVAREVPEAAVTTVAARDLTRAQRYADRHTIPRAYGSYDELLADPSIDAVYNPLPNSLHAPWTLKAIAAGKHVLCEKPFASNAAEAEQVAAAAAAAGLVVMDAMHYRYHPLIQQLAAQARVIGPIRRIQCRTSFPISDPADIRYDYQLGGGALMDGGCYALDCIRLLAATVHDSDAPVVEAALAHTDPPGMDITTAARLSLPGGGTAWCESAFTRDGELLDDVHVIGDGGRLWLRNFILGHAGRLVVTMDGAVTADIPGDGDTTWTRQLRAFAAAIRHGDSFPTTPENAIATMRLIDNAYRAAGLLPRGA